jgi:hypothetical protein
VSLPSTRRSNEPMSACLNAEVGCEVKQANVAVAYVAGKVPPWCPVSCDKRDGQHREKSEPPAVLRRLYGQTARRDDGTRTADVPTHH